jgi:hypothetical protein
VEHGKLTDLALYRQLRASGAFATPVIPAPRLRLDTAAFAPAVAAARIAAILA